jgi:hypothetical protein
MNPIQQAASHQTGEGQINNLLMTSVTFVAKSDSPQTIHTVTSSTVSIVPVVNVKQSFVMFHYNFMPGPHFVKNFSTAFAEQ